MKGMGLEFDPNSLYYGDCLTVLEQWPAGCVDLVYLDPPFNSKANYNVLYGSLIRACTSVTNAIADNLAEDPVRTHLAGAALRECASAVRKLANA